MRPAAAMYRFAKDGRAGAVLAAILRHIVGLIGIFRVYLGGRYSTYA